MRSKSMFLKLFILIVSTFLLVSNLYAQIDSPFPKCGTDEIYQKQLENSPEMVKNVQMLNENWIKFSKANNFRTYKKKRAKIELCIVFHNLLPNNTNTSFNKTKAIAVTKHLNKAYSSTGISFKLADIDVNRNPITSIDYAFKYSNNALDNADSKQIKDWSDVVQNTKKFPTSKYINIYVVNEILDSTLAFAHMPVSYGASFQGIYIDDNYLVDDIKEIAVLSHEMGHYLGLYHTFGICTNSVKNPNDVNGKSRIFSDGCGCVNDYCYTDGDMVCDTPPTKLIFGPLSPCTYAANPSAGKNSCDTDKSANGDQFNLTSDQPDIISNFMHYNQSYKDGCMNMFTPGQIMRMLYFLDPVNGVLKSLVNTSMCGSNCINACTISINGPVVIRGNKDTLRNTLFINNAENNISKSVSFNFKGNLCDIGVGAYKNFLWTVTDLSTNIVIAKFANLTTFNQKFYSVGNYRVTLKCFTVSGTDTCQQVTSSIIQVLSSDVCGNGAVNPTCCPADLGMAKGWDSKNWSRIKYENGWAREEKGEFSNKYGIPKLNILGTKMTVLVPSVTDEYFKIVTAADIKSDVNFSNITALPNSISKAFQVGKLINNTNNKMARGDASYVTYKFKPTVQNAKIRVYYLGVREYDMQTINQEGSFHKNIPQGTGFGIICNYKFKSVNGPIVSRGNTHEKQTGNFYRRNDTIKSGILTGNNITEFTLADKLTRLQKMKNWEHVDLDFSDFLCNTDTVTITFFARSNNASDLGFFHSYAYFATECLPGNFSNIDLNLQNVTTSCYVEPDSISDRYIKSCARVYVPNIVHDQKYDDLLDVTVEQSDDKLTWTPYTKVSNNFVDICRPTKDLDPTKPYKFFRFKYKTLCQVKTQEISFMHAFSHKVAPCPGKKLTGGHHITDSTKSIRYVEFCDSTRLKLTAPCWTKSTDTNQYYIWQVSTGGLFVDYTKATKQQDLKLTTADLKNIYKKCVQFRRVALIYDEYCSTFTGVQSDTFIVTSFKVMPLKHSTVGPNVCAKSETKVIIKNLYEEDLTCDPYFSKYFTSKKTYNISLQLFEDKECKKPIYEIDPKTGKSSTKLCKKDTTFINGLGSVASNIQSGPLTINTPFYFINRLYQQGNIYVKISNNRDFDGCKTDTVVLPIWIPIKPSCVPGTLSNPRVCKNEYVTVDGSGEMTGIVTTPYDWEYLNTKVTPNKWTTITTNKYGANYEDLKVLYNDFLTLLNNKTTLWVRRLAPGTQDCPKRFFSDSIALSPMPFGTMRAYLSKDSLCLGDQVQINGIKTTVDNPKNFYFTTKRPKYPNVDSSVVFNNILDTKNYSQKDNSQIINKDSIKYYVFAKYGEPVGCYSPFDSVTVHAKKFNDIKSSITRFCPGDVLTLTVSPKNFKTDNVTWTYNNIIIKTPIKNGIFTLTNVIVTQPTSVYVTGIDISGCIVKTSITLTPKTAPQITNFTATNGLVSQPDKVNKPNEYTVTLCNGSDATTFVPSVLKPNNFSFSWWYKKTTTGPNVSEGSATIKPVYPELFVKFDKSTLEANNHYFKVKDTNKCYTEYTVKLVQAKLIDVKILGESLFCKNTNTILSTSVNAILNDKAYTYKWYANGVLIKDSVRPNLVINIASKTTYIVEITDPTSKCSKTFTKIVDVKQLGSFSLNTKVICQNTEFCITANLTGLKQKPGVNIPFKYWTTNLISSKKNFEPTLCLKIIDSVRVTYTLTDFNDCKITKDTLIQVSGPSVNILGGIGTPKISGDTTILYTCANTPITISAKASGGVQIPSKYYGHLWSWSTTGVENTKTANGFTSSLTNILPGKTVYKVVVNDAGSCTRTKYVRVIVSPAPFDVKINDTVVCQGDSALVTAKIVDLTGKPLNLSNFDVTFTYTGGKANAGSFPTINGNQTYVKYITWFGNAAEFTVIVKPKNNTADPCLTMVKKSFKVTQKNSAFTATLSSINIDTTKLHCPGTPFKVEICSNEPLDISKLIIKKTGTCSLYEFKTNDKIRSFITLESKRGTYCYSVSYSVIGGTPYNLKDNCNKYTITHPCMNPIDFYIRSGNDLTVQVEGDTVVCSNDSTTLNAVLNSDFGVTNAKVSWTDCNNKPIPVLANKTGIKVGVGCYKLTVVSPCGNKYTKIVNVKQIPDSILRLKIVSSYDCKTNQTILQIQPFESSATYYWNDGTTGGTKIVNNINIDTKFSVQYMFGHTKPGPQICQSIIIKPLPCTKPTTGIKTVQIATGWYSKSPTGTCDASTFKSYVNKADLIDKYDTRKYVNGGWIFNYCYNAEKVDFVFDTINKSFIGSQLYVSGTCKPFKDGYYVISADDYYQVIKRMSCAFAFHVSCGKVDSLFTNCINDYRGLGKVILGPNSFEQSTSNPKVVSEIKIHPNPNNGQFSVILDNAQVDSYRIDVYDLNGKLIHTQNMYDEKSGTIQTKLDLTSYRLAKGLYMIHAITNDDKFIERVEIE